MYYEFQMFVTSFKSIPFRDDSNGNNVANFTISICFLKKIKLITTFKHRRTIFSRILYPEIDDSTVCHTLNPEDLNGQ